MGAEAIEAPMIRIVPPDDYGPLDEACAQRRRRSTGSSSRARNAVDAFIERLLASPLDLRALGRREAVRRRPGDGRAAGALRPEGRSRSPAEYRAEAVRAARCRDAATSRGLQVLLPHADIGREVHRRRTARSRAPTSPRSSPTAPSSIEPEREGEPDIYRMLLERRIDVVTFTSPSAVRNFVRAARRRAGRRSAADDGRRRRSAR